MNQDQGQPHARAAWQDFIGEAASKAAEAAKVADAGRTIPPLDLGRLFRCIDEANAIASDCFARGELALGIEVLAIAAHHVQTAMALKRMHDAFRSYHGSP